MTRWMRPCEDPGDMTCGDRIVIVVRERATTTAPLQNRLVILEATEDGWHSADPVYAGYSLHDGLLWAKEQDLCSIANVVLGAPNP
jgi:hypothetical protein